MRNQIRSSHFLYFSKIPYILLLLLPVSFTSGASSSDPSTFSFLDYFTECKVEALVLATDFYEKYVGIVFESVSAARNTDTLDRVFIAAISQLMGLIASLCILIYLANQCVEFVSEVQRSLLRKMSSLKLKKLLIGFLWIVKPNMSWLVVVLGSYFISLLVPNTWVLLSLILPFGFFYAVYRAFRVITEWLLNRAHTRAARFVSISKSKALQQESIRISIHLSVIFLSGYFVIFYTDYIRLSLLPILAGWLWILTMLVAKKNAFLMNKLFSNKATNDQVDPFSRVFFYPVLYFLAHFLDLTIQLHTRLLALDDYRSLTAKLIRSQLEKKSDVEEQKEACLSYEFYKNLILKDVANEDLIRLEDLIQDLLRPITKWQHSQTEENVLLVVGEQGSGKSVLLKYLDAELTDLDVRRVEVPEKTLDRSSFFSAISTAFDGEQIENVEQLANMSGAEKRKLIVLENAHQLFLSDVGCFDAYRALLTCLNAQLENIFWVVVIHKESWVYLDQVFRREQQFSQILAMPKWSAANIKHLILSKHEKSHRKLVYNQLLFSAAANSESSSIRSADDRVFNILWEQAEGNPKLALALWIKATKLQGYHVEVAVPQMPPVSALTDLGDDLCFVYAAILTHRSLNEGELIAVTHLSESVVRYALKKGVNMGVVSRRLDLRYEVDVLWSKTLRSYLISKNMVLS